MDRTGTDGARSVNIMASIAIVTGAAAVTAATVRAVRAHIHKMRRREWAPPYITFTSDDLMTDAEAEAANTADDMTLWERELENK